jgi:hypothetical protein
MQVFVLFLLTPWSVEPTKLRRPAKKTGVKSHADDAFCFGGRQPLILSGQSGWFASPNYPQNYPNNADCQWLILSQNPEMVSFDSVCMHSIVCLHHFWRQLIKRAFTLCTHLRFSPFAKSVHKTIDTTRAKHFIYHSFYYSSFLIRREESNECTFWFMSQPFKW